jgi:hypothetical protein
MKKWLGVVLLVVLLGAFAYLWVKSGDFVLSFLAIVVILLGLGLLLAILGYLFSNTPLWWRKARGVSHGAHLVDLEGAGKARRERYEARRALTFQDLNTMCVAYLIDVGDDCVLSFYGQHYYDFEPGEDNYGNPEQRRFPTTQFSLLREVRSGDVLDVSPGTTVLEPRTLGEISATRSLHKLGFKAEDGQILKGISLDVLEQALSAAK